MAADVPTRLATDSLTRLRVLLQEDNKVKVAGCVTMCMHRLTLTDPVTQVSTVGPEDIF
jgi:hypothetical protein